PGDVVVAPGHSFPFAAAGVDQFGQAFTPAVAWTVDTGGSGSIDSGGVYTAGAPGPATVRAAANGLSATANVIVSATLPPTVPPPPPPGGSPPPPGVPPTVPPTTVARGFAVGEDAGGSPVVRLLNPDGSERWS